MSEICGIATLYPAGQRPFIWYATCCLWFGLSSETPFQQAGNVTWSRNIEPLVSGHAGGVLDAGTPTMAPQFQNVTCLRCGVCAVASPAIILKPGGVACTCCSVLRR